MCPERGPPAPPPRSPRQPLRRRHHLLEGRPVLERERRQRDAAGHLGPVLVEAGGLRVGGAGAVTASVELPGARLQRRREAVLEGAATLPLRAAAAVHAAPGSL